jgi:putative tryptophan/tyrosine transport system substrate-binding protein
MRRREFIGLAGGVAAWPLIAKAQPDGQMRRIGVLIGGTEGDPQITKYLEAFSSGLRQLGWIAGQNIRIDYGWARGDIGRARSLAMEARRRRWPCTRQRRHCRSYSSTSQTRLPEVL